MKDLSPYPAEQRWVSPMVYRKHLRFLELRLCWTSQQNTYRTRFVWRVGYTLQTLNARVLLTEFLNRRAQFRNKLSLLFHYFRGRALNIIGIG